jgi:hypothetical protein
MNTEEQELDILVGSLTLKQIGELGRLFKRNRGDQPRCTLIKCCTTTSYYYMFQVAYLKHQFECFSADVSEETVMLALNINYHHELGSGYSFEGICSWYENNYAKIAKAACDNLIKDKLIKNKLKKDL